MAIEKRIFITGGSGRLGRYFLKILKGNKNIKLYAPSSRCCDITDYSKLLSEIEKFNPDIIFHLAAYTDVKKAESDDFVKCMDINVLGTLNLIKCCAKNNIRLAYISTDAVFDGEKGNYRPSDPVSPLNKYARTKCAAEMCVRNYENSCIIRASFFEYDFPYDAAFVDQLTSKDYIDITGKLILNTCLNFERSMIYHIGTDNKSMYELAKKRKDVRKIKISDFNSLNIARNLTFDRKIKKEKY